MKENVTGPHIEAEQQNHDQHWLITIAVSTMKKKLHIFYAQIILRIRKSYTIYRSYKEITKNYITSYKNITNHGIFFNHLKEIYNYFLNTSSHIHERIYSMLQNNSGNKLT